MPETRIVIGTVIPGDPVPLLQEGLRQGRALHPGRWGVGSRADMAQTGRPAGPGEDVRAATGAVVSHEAAAKPPLANRSRKSPAVQQSNRMIWRLACPTVAVAETSSTAGDLGR